MLRGKGTALARTAGATVLRRAILRRAVLRTAASTGRGLALVYHRVRPEGAAPHEVVPTLPTALVREQLELLAEVGDIVPLSELYEPPATRGRVRFAISFDDDEPSHVEHALPLLRSLGLRATFFLSGRALHGVGPYWWRCLEGLIAERGLEEACHVLGIGATSPAELAARCEGSPLDERICALSPACDIPDLDADGIRALQVNGMTIGFHTLFHPVLTALSRDDLGAALESGRTELSAAAGAPVRLLAYPHGRTDARVARAAAAAGYDAAFRAGGRPIAPGSHRYYLGRWEPSAIGGDPFLASIALRLMRPADARPG